jgi:hypothetical protein
MLKEPKEPRASRSGLERLTPRFEPQTIEDRSSMKGFARHRAPSGEVTVGIAGIAIVELAIAPRGLSVHPSW